MTFGAARDGLVHELRLLGARDIVISSNLPLRRDGLPYANKAEPEDTAVAVYFTLDGAERCIPCDRWDRVRDNLRAIALTIAALRGLERWGTHQIVAAAFQGFAALPAGGADGWWTVLGVPPSANRADIEAAYRRLAKVHHPDAGGDAERFRIITEARRMGMEALTI
jgi:hypothetical protein